MYQPSSIKGLLSMRGETTTENDKEQTYDDILQEMDAELAQMQAWRKKNEEDEAMLQEILNRDVSVKAVEPEEVVEDEPEKREIHVNKEALKCQVQPDSFNTQEIIKDPAKPIQVSANSGPDMSNRDLFDISYKIAESLSSEPKPETEAVGDKVDLKSQLEDIEKQLAELEAECDGVTLTNDY